MMALRGAFAAKRNVSSASASLYGNFLSGFNFSSRFASRRLLPRFSTTDPLSRYTIRGRSTVKPAYGESDFIVMRKNNQFYADKTGFAVNLLSTRRAVLQRPPRMGKSLFIDMVKCLYDVSFKQDFNMLFDGLYAGSENLPAEVKDTFNSFRVLVITLPGVAGDLARCESEFHDQVLGGIAELLMIHPDVLEKLGHTQFQQFIDKYENRSNLALDLISKVVGRENLMVLVDEYDRAPMDLYATIDKDDAAKHSIVKKF